jgi:hypothetical protein
LCIIEGIHTHSVHKCDPVYKGSCPGLSKPQLKPEGQQYGNYNHPDCEKIGETVGVRACIPNTLGTKCIESPFPMPDKPCAGKTIAGGSC